MMECRKRQFILLLSWKVLRSMKHRKLLFVHILQRFYHMLMLLVFSWCVHVRRHNSYVSHHSSCRFKNEGKNGETFSKCLGERRQQSVLANRGHTMPSSPSIPEIPNRVFVIFSPACTLWLYSADGKPVGKYQPEVRRFEAAAGKKLFFIRNMTAAFSALNKRLLSPVSVTKN